MQRADVVVIGGGVIGLSIAFELSGRGITVAVLEQGQFGREASWAGAGILPPGRWESAATPEARLRGLSHRVWNELSARLQSETGIDTGYDRCGGIILDGGDSSSALQARVTDWQTEGVEVERLTSDQLIDLEPHVSPKSTSAIRVPEMGQVRNPRHLKALVTGCAKRGVTLCEGEPVLDVSVRQGRVDSIVTAKDQWAAGTACVTAGAWSQSVLRNARVDLPVRPIRGQIVLLSARPLPFRHVLEVGSRYLVPRSDGRVLIGSTEEDVGFDKRNTAEAIAGLIEFGQGIVPALKQATFERAWSGLRPGSADGRPYLGRVPDVENLVMATGHFRSGLQMSPGTAVLMRECIFGEPSSIPLSDFSLDRHMHSSSDSSGGNIS